MWVGLVARRRGLAEMQSRYSTHNTNVKLVLVGDGDVGKTCLLTVFATDRFPTEYIPIVFDSRASNEEIDGRPFLLTPFDTGGYEGHDRWRPFSYPQTDVFLLCFSLVDYESYENVEARWYPELSYHCPNVPIILVGTKLDLREDEEHVGSSPLLKSVSMQEGIKMMTKNHNVVKYLECSALTKYGVKDVFDEAARAALGLQDSTSTRRNNKCFVL